jgi:hypothetical protein
VKVKGPSYLLILLLAAASLDDLWACATPDPCDDAQAAENNEYLASYRPCPRDGTRGWDQPSPRGCPEGAGGLAVAAPLRALPLAGSSRAPFGPALLYVLMSLQR